MSSYRALALAVAFLLSPIAAAAQQGRVVHGADSIFAGSGVKIAWAVCRGATEAEALVVIRIVLADASYRFIRVDGVDPFSKDHKVFVGVRALDRETDLAIPRAQFADHGSTEMSFFANAEDAGGNRPKLVIFYLGVPDTTPEFASRREAEAYLDRILGDKK
jgi:hypothetical protein